MGIIKMTGSDFDLTPLEAGHTQKISDLTGNRPGVSGAGKENLRRPCIARDHRAETVRPEPFRYRSFRQKERPGWHGVFAEGNAGQSYEGLEPSPDAMRGAGGLRRNGRHCHRDGGAACRRTRLDVEHDARLAR